MRLSLGTALFSSPLENEDGQRIAGDVLTSVGGLDSIVSQIPLDKGQMSNSIMLLCYRLADAISAVNSKLAERLRTSAAAIAVNQTNAGEQHSTEAPHDVVGVLTDALRLAVATEEGFEDLSADSLVLQRWVSTRD